jgi:hypothetical protein
MQNPEEAMEVKRPTVYALLAETLAAMHKWLGVS